MKGIRKKRKTFHKNLKKPICSNGSFEGIYKEFKAGKMKVPHEKWLHGSFTNQITPLLHNRKICNFINHSNKRVNKRNVYISP